MLQRMWRNKKYKQQLKDILKEIKQVMLTKQQGVVLKMTESQEKWRTKYSSATKIQILCRKYLTKKRKYSKRRRASIAYMESTVVDISMTSPSFKPVSLALLQSSLF